MRAAGFSTYPYKLAAFVIAGALAGLAGALLAIKDGAVNPELLSWHESGAVLLMIILGGIGSLRGAVIGAAAFTLLKELVQSEALFGPLASHWQLTLGLAIIAFVALLPKGLIGLGALLRGTGRVAEQALLRAEPACGRRFGGLAAVDAVSIELHVGEIHAVIGTNGAGKSTLVNMLSGELAPTRRLGPLRRPRRHPLGAAAARPRRLGRSYQRTTIFNEFSVLENCRLAAQARAPRPWTFWERAAGDARSLAAAERGARRRRAGGARGAHRRHPQPRRQAPARDRDVPGDRAPGAAPRRAARRHGRRGERPHAGAARRRSSPATRSCWSSTTWTRCSASPTGSR